MDMFNLSSFTVLALISLSIVVQQSGFSQAEDIGTNFFLKASKSVPRIGRRSMDYENFFLKASKNVPRIGRRRTLSPAMDADPDYLTSGVEKRISPQKYYNDRGHLIWGNVEKPFEEYPEMFQGDEPYRETDPENYWHRLKRSTRNNA